MAFACVCAPARGGRSSPGAGPRAAAASRREAPTDVRAVLRNGTSVAGERVILYVAPEAGEARAGFVVSKRVGGAVARNRARRILRAAWRSLAPSVAEGVDAVFIARESIKGAKTQDLEPEMRELLRRSGAMRS
jgi:ribonuclease P protein component